MVLPHHWCQSPECGYILPVLIPLKHLVGVAEIWMSYCMLCIVFHACHHSRRHSYDRLNWRQRVPFFATAFFFSWQRDDCTLCNSWIRTKGTWQPWDAQHALHMRFDLWYPSSYDKYLFQTQFACEWMHRSAYHSIVWVCGCHGGRCLCCKLIQFTCSHTFVDSCCDLLCHSHLQYLLAQQYATMNLKQTTSSSNRTSVKSLKLEPLLAMRAEEPFGQIHREACWLL